MTVIVTHLIIGITNMVSMTGSMTVYDGIYDGTFGEHDDPPLSG